MREIYEKVITAPSFTVTSSDLRNDQELKIDQLGEKLGSNISPELSWEGFNSQTKSFVITMYDNDAPTGSGFWHWVVYDIPANITNLKRKAGSAPCELPKGAKMLKNDAGIPLYVGPSPIPKSGIHHYVITVTALDIDHIEIDPNSTTPAMLGLMIASHTLGRARIIPIVTAK